MRIGKKSRIGMAAVTAFGLLTTSLGMAYGSDNNGVGPYPRLVSLGDSITFGYNLSTSNSHPSKEAFPFIIGKDEDFQVRDISVPGWTSADLLQALQSNHYVQQSVKYANVITIDIGSYDILSIAIKAGLLSPNNPKPTPTPSETKAFSTAIQAFAGNLDKIVDRIKSLSPNSTIVLYNIYNPIPSIATQLHVLGEQWIGQENRVVAKVGASYDVGIADAYRAFNGKQTTYVGFADVHPTVLGQKALAAVGEAALTNER